MKNVTQSKNSLWNRKKYNNSTCQLTPAAVILFLSQSEAMSHSSQLHKSLKKKMIEHRAVSLQQLGFLLFTCHLCDAIKNKNQRICFLAPSMKLYFEASLVGKMKSWYWIYSRRWIFHSFSRQFNTNQSQKVS